MPTSFDNYRAGLPGANSTFTGAGFMSNGSGGSIIPGPSGHGPFGGIPAPLSVPANRLTQASAAIPSYASLSPAVSGVIGSQLAGKPSANTISALTTAAAQRGAGRGMPGSNDFTNNDLFGNIAGYSENLQNQGVGNFNQLLNTTMSGTTDPNLAAEIAGTNASNAAAPDPTAAATYAQSLFNQYLNKFNIPAGNGINPAFRTGTYGGSGGGYGKPPATQSASVSGMPNLRPQQPQNFGPIGDFGVSSGVGGSVSNLPNQNNGMYYGGTWSPSAPTAPAMNGGYYASTNPVDPWGGYGQNDFPDLFGTE